jgi:hypothetical protein
MHGDEQIGWQRPRCCGPDRDAGFVFERARNNWKLHEDGGVIAFLIFHFGFGEGGLGAGAPEDRLHRLVNQTLLHEDGEGAQDLGFVFGIHGEVGMFPIAENAEAFELLALDIDEFARESFATFAAPRAARGRVIPSPPCIQWGVRGSPNPGRKARVYRAWFGISPRNPSEFC